MNARFSDRIHVEVEFTDQELDDLLCAALEGGVTAIWVGEPVTPVGGVFPPGAEYAHECLTRGTPLRFLEVGDGDVRKEHVLTLDAFKAGIAKAIASGNWSAHDFLDGQDAETADVVVQYALFGRIVYG